MTGITNDLLPQLHWKQLPRTTCIWCGEREARPKQRTCQPCHSDYKRNHDRKRRAEAKAQFSSDFLIGQLSLAG